MECLLDACDELAHHYSQWHEVERQAALAAEIYSIEKAFLKIEQASNDWLVNNTTIKSVSVTEQLKLELKVQHKMVDKLTQELETTFNQVMKDCDNKPTVQADDRKQSTQEPYSEVPGVLSKTSIAAVASTSLGRPVS